MRQDNLGWIRWLVPVGLGLACLLIAVGALTGRVAARQTAPPPHLPGEQIEPPSAQEEALWAAVGLNDAWYVANGYTENPPPSAPSPFWPETKESTGRSEILTPPIVAEPRAFIDPPNAAGQAVADHRTMPLEAALCGSENNYCEDNDTPGTAHGPLGLGITYQAYPDDMDDYYYFELSAAGAVVVNVTDYAPTSSNGTVMLYGPADGEDLGEPIDYYGPRGHSSMLLEPEDLLRQGKYFVWVYTASSYTTTQLYDLTVTARSERNYLPLALRHFSLNHPPFVPSSPQPSGGATDQSVNVSLKWTAGDPDGDSVTYDVFLEANDNTPDVLVCDDATSASCDAGTLSYEANYYWQVIARDPDGVTMPGPVWTFSTQEPMAEVRAIWLTRFDWTAYSGGDEGRAKFDEIVANVAGAGFNTIFFQVRGNGDAYYEPGLEPWSARLNNGGVLGQRPYPYWDPLGYMIEKAHSRGIQVHAYVNMYPAWVGTEAPPQGTEPVHPYWTWSSVHGQLDWRQRNSAGQISPAPENKYLWASPGVDEVRDHIVAVVSDIVSRYNVDGVHLDLVRYINRDYSYDRISNAAIAASGKDRGDWQRERVTDLVRRIYQAIGQPESGIHLSAAVWFCYDDCGFGLSSGFAGRYQDSIGWLRDGIIDAIAPMLYAADAFQSNSTWQTVMLQFQDREEIAGRPVYPGIHGTLSFSDIATRIQYTRDAGAVGHAIFSYGHVDQNGYWDDFANGPYAQPAMVAPVP